MTTVAPTPPNNTESRKAQLVKNQVKPTRKLTWSIVLLIVLALAGLSAYFLIRPKPVATVQVTMGNVVRAFYATGTVRPDFEYLLKSRVQGTLLELNVREGQAVTAGQVLARVDDKQLRFEVEKAQAELKEALAQAADQAPQRAELLARLQESKSQLEISSAELKRVLDTFNKGVSNISDVDAARRSHVQWSQSIAALESQLGTWKIESQRKVEVAQANLRKAQANLAETEVRAPINGLILERYIEANEVVSLNQKLFLLADPADKLMKAKVDEEDIARTRLGQTVWMQLYAFNSPDPEIPAKLFEGRVQQILPTADPVNKTFEVKVAFVSPPPQLRVGMTAELNFIDSPPLMNSEPGAATQANPSLAASGGATASDQTAQRKLALVVPATAVMDGKVYRVINGKYVPTEVKMGVRSLEKVEILPGSDLKEGDQIVADAKQVAPIKLPETAKTIIPTRNGDKPKE